MSSPSRTAQFAKVHKVLKKYYKPVLPNPERPVLEHLLFACCLENAHFEKADEAFAALVHTFFDWNEMRVTTVKELSEVISSLPDPPAAAHRVKRVLQHVFETTYSFDLEELRKKNLGQAVERLKKANGATPFGVNYVIQSALGGHAVPIDSGAMEILRILDLVTDKDADAGVVPGLERAVAKNKGVEFGALLHQLAAEFTANPYVPNVHKILLAINPDATERLPKRRPKAKPEQPAPAPKAAEPTGTGKAEDENARRRKKKPGQPDAAADEPTATPAAASAPAPAAAPTAPVEAKAPPKKKPTPTKTPPETEPEDVEHVGRKSAMAGLSKRKPR
jgi:endonuclease III